MNFTHFIRLGAVAGAVLLAAAPPALAQGTGQAMLEEIIVTATKRAGGIDVQQAPVAVSAYGAEQLDAMHIRNLSAIGFAAPSVQLEDIGTARGVANFSIRGIGINSSIPSIDPTVGVFVDGVYLGINGGVVLDIFDLQSVEVLRGPQGILFGRNVTGGAVLLNTTRPGDSLYIDARAAQETGSNLYLSGVISGPFTDTIGGKLAVYYNDDGGWFDTNQAIPGDHGKAETTMVRGALEFEPSNNFDLILRYEHGESDGDGPASQNAGLFSEDSFDFSIDERGFYDYEWNQVVAEFNWDVDFGDGTITSITGWRDWDTLTLGDIDASPLFLFHAFSSTDQDQISEELRYSGTFGQTNLTTGVYYFSQDLQYIEQRLIPPAGLDITGGGDQEHDVWGVFAQVDYAINDVWTLNLGGRYTEEEKDATIATLFLNLCELEVGCTGGDLVDSRDWSNFSPKIGFQAQPDDDTQYYGFWTQAFRSGGYNMRHTALGIPNQPFDEEEVSSFELGVKKDLAGGRMRLNGAVYYNQVDDMQREVNLSDPVVGVVQLIRNTADATITGVDLEFSASITDDLFFRATAGYVHGEYDSVRFDLNGDGVVNEADTELDIPRLAPWSYGAEFVYERETAWGTFIAQASGYHRDRNAYTDNNEGYLREIDKFDARLALRTWENQLTIALFGKNLADESTIGGDTQLPDNFAGGPLFPVPGLAGPGATFSPLNKGRIYGLELHYQSN